MKTKILGFGIAAFLCLFITGNTNAYPMQVQYEYYNWYDYAFLYEISESDFLGYGGSIISVEQYEGNWLFRGTPPTGGSSEEHVFKHKLVVTVLNNKEQDSLWPYDCNTHYPFTIRIMSHTPGLPLDRVKYIDDTRDPMTYSVGTLSTVDNHWIAPPYYPSPATSFYNRVPSDPYYERFLFQIGINWRCVCDSVPAPVPEPATLFLLGSGLLGILGLRRKFRK